MLQTGTGGYGRIYIFTTCAPQKQAIQGYVAENKI